MEVDIQNTTMQEHRHTNISDEVLWPMAGIHKVLAIVIVWVKTLCTLKWNK